MRFLEVKDMDVQRAIEERRLERKGFEEFAEFI